MKGIIPRAANQIFDFIKKSELDIDFTIKCSMLEIYRENLRDLLNPGGGIELKIKFSKRKGIYIEGLTEEV